jgi:tetratricopeptide (TPR) repeat protein
MSKPKKKQKKGVKGKPIPIENQRNWHSRIFPNLLAIALIMVVASVVYLNSFHVSFRFDDILNILYNPNVQIKIFSWERLEQSFKITYEETIRVFSYFTFALNYYFGEFNVFGYHLVNLIVHIASGIFLYWFLILTFNLLSLKERYGPISYKVALFTSLIFIVHPIQTQSVTYIVQRMSSMAGMFYLLSLVLYIKGRLSTGWPRVFCFGGMVLSYLLGVFSKENAAILPAFVALYEFYFFQNLDLSPKGRKVLFSLVGALLILGAFGFIIWGQRYINVIIEGYQYRSFTMSERVLTQFRVVLYYLTLLIYPHPSRLNLDYDFPISKTILDPPTTLISLLIIAGLIGYSIWTAKKRPVISFCILWYFGNLVIESSIFPLEMVYEHRLYLPAVGPFILFSILVVRGIEFVKRRRDWVGIKPYLMEIAICSLILIVLAMGTYLRNKLWNNDIEFWIDCVKKSPNKARPYVNVGFTYLNEGVYDKAIDWTQKALQIDPQYATPYYNLGVIYEKLGDLDQAIIMWRKSLETDPGLYLAHYSLGKTYLRKGQCEEAQVALKEYLNVYSYSPDAHNYLGIAYVCLKQFDKAIKEFEWELQINPYHPFAHLNLGRIYWYEFQNRRKAVYHLKAALGLLGPFFPDREEIVKLVQSLEGLS